MGSRPPRWLSGMKLTLNTGTSADDANVDVQNDANVCSVIMAPFGAPVEPEVYMIIASRSSLPPVYAGSCGSRAATLDDMG